MRWLPAIVTGLMWLTVATVGGAAGPARAAPAGTFDWPLTPRPQVVREFDKPEHRWLPGHRGVDLAGAAGQTVLASGPGIVVFAGMVAGTPVVSVDHAGGLRTTYQPVRASVAAGRRVERGTPLGTLQPGHPDCPGVCLHWGLRREHKYLNPLGLLQRAPIRLKPVAPRSFAG